MSVKENESEEDYSKSSIDKVLNADINGAIGIMRKVYAISDVQIMGLRDRGDVVLTLHLDIK